MTRLFTLLFLLFFNFSNYADVTQVSHPTPIRLAIVNTPVYSGLIQYLVNDFEQQTGLHVELTNGSDVFEIAKSEQADIVISHFGKAHLDQFVLEGFGEWPKMVFSNQAVIIGPSSDPAKIKGSINAAQALIKIAHSQSKFIASPQAGVQYLTDIIWNQARQPNKSPWFIEPNDGGNSVAKFAEQQQAYFIWGAIPFLKYKAKNNSKLTILINDDPLLQRVMSSTIVNPKKMNSSNYAGAKALQDYLLKASTQAKIAAFRTPNSDLQLWWPAARHN